MTADRALGFSESFFHFMHGLGAYVIVVGARMRGPVQEDALRRALARAQERHPLLRVHVVEERGVLMFREKGTLEIPLRVARAPFDEAMEDEISRPIAGPAGSARLRALLLRGEGDAFDLLLAMDHTVCDGASLISILQDVLADFDGASPAAPFPPLPSIEALLLARGPIPKWTGKNEEQEVPLVPKKRPPGARRTRLFFRDLNVAETARLAARCRAERTSVNGALTAAALVAMQKHAQSPAHLGVITNVALRDKADPPVGIERVGNFVSFVQTYHDVSAATPLWDLARECRDAVSAHVAAGEPEGRLSEGQLLWWQRGYLRHVAPRIQHGVSNALAISNSGRLPLAGQRGAFSVEGVYAASSQHVLGSSIALFVWSVPDALRISAACVEPIVTKETAAGVVDEIVRTLSM
jgi:hypothetical protein